MGLCHRAAPVQTQSSRSSPPAQFPGPCDQGVLNHSHVRAGRGLSGFPRHPSLNPPVPLPRCGQPPPPSGPDAPHAAPRSGPMRPTRQPRGGAICGRHRPRAPEPRFEGTPAVKPNLYGPGRNPIRAPSRASRCTASRAFEVFFIGGRGHPRSERPRNAFDADLIPLGNADTGTELHARPGTRYIGRVISRTSHMSPARLLDALPFVTSITHAIRFFMTVERSARHI